MVSNTSGERESSLTPRTIVRAGVLSEDLERVMVRTGLPFNPCGFGLGNTVKYVVIGEETPISGPYLLFAVQQKDKIIGPSGNNFHYSVTSYSNQRNQEVACDFEKKIGIACNIRQNPGFVQAVEGWMNLSFPIFLRCPKEAINVLNRI
jgi:hypothetical protein